MLDALVDGQYRNVARAAQPASVEQQAEVAQHRDRPVAPRVHPVHEVRPRQDQVIAADALALVRRRGSASSPSSW